MLDIACREYGAQWPSAAIVVTRASTWRDDPDLAWRYPFHVQRLEGLDIPTFPLINLWDGEDDQIPALKATAKELEFRDPIIGNLYRDGGDALAPQLDAFVDAVTNGLCRPNRTATRAWLWWRTCVGSPRTRMAFRPTV